MTWFGFHFPSHGSGASTFGSQNRRREKETERKKQHPPAIKTKLMLIQLALQHHYGGGTLWLRGTLPSTNRRGVSSSQPSSSSSSSLAVSFPNLMRCCCCYCLQLRWFRRVQSHLPCKSCGQTREKPAISWRGAGFFFERSLKNVNPNVFIFAMAMQSLCM